MYPEANANFQIKLTSIGMKKSYFSHLVGCEQGYRFDMVTESCSVCPLNTACTGLTLSGDPCPARSFSIPYLVKKCVSLAWLSIPSGVIGLAFVTFAVMKVRAKISTTQRIQVCACAIYYDIVNEKIGYNSM